MPPALANRFSSCSLGLHPNLPDSLLLIASTNTLLCFTPVLCFPATPQAQRVAAGLPPEHGPNAAILTAVHGLMHEVVRPYLFIFAVLLTGSLWDWSCVLSAPVPADGRAS
jgi:hypothetical protein